MAILRSKTTHSLKWSAIERIATQAIQLIVMLILGRIIGPQAFGLIGMLAIFIALAQTFIDSGFSNALIRKQDANEADYATTFYFSVAVAVFCYLLLFISAPYIADFYQQSELTILTQILALTIVANAFSTVQRTQLTTAMDFKTQAKASLLSVVLSTAVAILCAMLGLGVWALVAQTLSFAIANTLALNFYVRWYPKTGFSKQSFNYLFGFGSKLLLSGLIDTVYNNVYQIIIGKLFSPAQLGLFTQAKNLTYMPSMTLTAIIQRVTYPMMSQIQHDKDELESAYLLTLRLAAVVIFPLLIGLAIIAEPFVVIVMGVEWRSTAILMSILAVGYMLYPIHAINLNLLQVKGRSDLFLKLEVIKKIIITIILLITVPLGIKAICIGIAIQSYIALLINTYYTGKLTSLNIKRQCARLIPIWAISIFSGILTWIISQYINNQVVEILSMLIIMPVIYIVTVRLVVPDLFHHIYSTILKKNN